MRWRDNFDCFSNYITYAFLFITGLNWNFCFSEYISFIIKFVTLQTYENLNHTLEKNVHYIYESNSKGVLSNKKKKYLWSFRRHKEELQTFIKMFFKSCEHIFAECVETLNTLKVPFLLILIACHIYDQTPFSVTIFVHLNPLLKIQSFQNSKNFCRLKKVLNIKSFIRSVTLFNPNILYKVFLAI